MEDPSHGIKRKRHGVSISGIQNPLQRTTSLGKKTKTSSFLITINTNKRYPIGPQGQSHTLQLAAEKLRRVTQEFTELIEERGNFIRFMDPEASFTSDWIKGVETEGAIERGAQFDQLHAHVGLTIKHYTRIQLDYKKIREFFIIRLNMANVYVNVQLIPAGQNPRDILKKYLRKNQAIQF